MHKNYGPHKKPKSHIPKVSEKYLNEVAIFQVHFNNSVLSDIILRLELYGVKLHKIEFLEKHSPHSMLRILYYSNSANNVSIRLFKVDFCPSDCQVDQ